MSYFDQFEIWGLLPGTKFGQRILIIIFGQIDKIHIVRTFRKFATLELTAL